MSNTSIKPMIVDILNDSKQAILDFYNELSDEERNRKAELKNWQAKEIIIHNMAWCKLFNQALVDIKANKEPRIESNYLEYNDQVYLQTENQTWQETLDEIEDVYYLIMNIIEGMSEEDISRTDFHEVFGSKSVGEQLVGYYYSHLFYHLADYDFQNDRTEKAIRLMLDMPDRLAKFDDSPRTKAASYYNVACFFTGMDEFEEALKYLELALPLSPDLKSWAREDPDLAKLLENERFLILTNPEA